MNEKVMKSTHVRREGVIKWKKEGEIIVITYNKNLSRVEEWIRKKIGGTKEIRRPLDEYTTFIWEKCDGENTIGEIIKKFDDKFGETVAPAGARVIGFMEKMLKINVIRLKS